MSTPPIPPVAECPGRLALCGVPCGCAGANPSHYPIPASTEEAERLRARWLNASLTAPTAQTRPDGGSS